MFKSILKNKVITSYYDKCIDPNNCVSCSRKDLDIRGLFGVDDLEGVDDIDRVQQIKLFCVAFMLVALWVRFC